MKDKFYTIPSNFFKIARTILEDISFKNFAAPCLPDDACNLPHDTPTDEVYLHSNWNTLTFYYKLRLSKLFHSVFIGEAPAALSYLTNKPRTAYNFRRSNNVIVPRFNSKFLKNSISYRGAILWNAVSTPFMGQFTDFYRKVKKEFYFKELHFSAQSAQSLPRHYQDFNTRKKWFLYRGEKLWNSLPTNLKTEKSSSPLYLFLV